VLYVLATLVLTGMQNYRYIDPKSGFSSAFASVGLSGLASVIAVGAIVGILTVMFTFMLGVTPGQRHDYLALTGRYVG
jgi:APA family basic amino acid/polyamine antiporter